MARTVPSESAGFLSVGGGTLSRPDVTLVEPCGSVAKGCRIDRADIIEVARLEARGVGQVRRVLLTARAAEDRRLLGICLDCFRSVLEDDTSPVAYDVAGFLGSLLADPLFRRIRRRVLITLACVGRASSVVLPQILQAYRKPSNSCTVAPARWAVVHVSWEALVHGTDSEQLMGLGTFTQLRSLGRLNLEECLRIHPSHPLREAIRAVIPLLPAG